MSNDTEFKQHIAQLQTEVTTLRALLDNVMNQRNVASNDVAILTVELSNAQKTIAQQAELLANKFGNQDAVDAKVAAPKVKGKHKHG